MAKNLRAVVTIEKAEATTTYVKKEAVTNYQKAESIAGRVDFSKNQWFYEDYTVLTSGEGHTGILLAELHVTVLLKNIAESVELSEAHISDFNKVTPETLSLLETFARVVQFQRTFTDAFTLDDAASIDKDYYGNKGNVAFMLDIIGLSINKIVTETVTVGDIHTAAVNKVVTENLNLIELQAKSFNSPKTNNFSVTDLLSVGPGLNKSDSISFSDTNYAALNKIVTNSMTMNDIVGIGTSIPITESFSFNDSIITGINKVITDAFTLDDSALIDKDYYGNKGNVFTVSDVIALALIYVRGFSNSISIGDSANIANISGKVLNGASFNRITLN